MTALSGFAKMKYGKMRGGDEIFIGRKYTGNKATLLFRKEAKPLVPRVPAFNDSCSRNH